MKKISIISAPSNLGLKPSADGRLSGVSKLPAALLENKLAERIGAELQAEIPVPSYVHEKHGELSILNPHGIHQFSLSLAAEVGQALENGYFPLVLGGDCSILLGNLLALKRLGRYGLFFMDGHADFYLPEQSQTGGVAGMDLAFATGRGADILSDIDGQKPLVREEDVVLFGYRDWQEAESWHMPKLSETRINAFNLRQIREFGVEAIVRESLKICRRQTQGVWIHIDADVLDDSIMPAVDARQPDGLSYMEFTTTLKMLMASGIVIGLHVGILDPDKDPMGKIIKEFTAQFIECFRE